MGGISLGRDDGSEVKEMATKRMKLQIIIIWMLAVVILTTGCGDGRVYDGNYPELYTVAISSIFGTRGYRLDPHPFPARVKVIEVDDYGRTLFLYNEGNLISRFSLVISQKSDDEYVYFLPHHTFISVERISPWPFDNIGDFELLRESIENSFLPEEIEELKERNDWNQPLNLDNAIRARIVTEKEEGPINDEALLEAYLAALGNDAVENALGRDDIMWFSQMDNYGRSIYRASGYNSEGDYWRTVVMLFQADGSFDVDTGVMELHDLQRYQDELKAFLVSNGWNQSWP